jgi:putative oxidoreductase
LAVATPETVVLHPEVEPRERVAIKWRNPAPLAWGPLAARVGLGVIMLMHGLQKLGIFGGGGWAATIDMFAKNLNIPPPLGALVILTEFVGGTLILFGFLTRLAAFAVLVEMVVAAYLVHVPNGFFLNWYLEPGKGHGFEMNLALVALALVCILEGAGRLSIDGRIAQRA